MQHGNEEEHTQKFNLYIPNMLMFVFTVFVLLSNLIPIPGLLSNALIATSGCVMFLYTIVYKREDKRIFFVIGLVVVLSVCMLISSWYNNNASVKEILWIWCYMGAALVMCYFDIDSRWVSVVFYLLSGYFFLCIFMHRSVHYILYSTSRNGISLLVQFVVFLLYICRKSDEKVVYLPAAVSLIISVWALGRAGVLTSAFLLCGIVIYGLVKEEKQSYKRIVAVGCVTVAAMILLAKVFPTNESLYVEKEHIVQAEETITEEDVKVNPYQNEQSVNIKGMYEHNAEEQKSETFLSRFSSYGFKSVRINIWAEYIEKTFSSGKNFMLGVNCSNGTYLSIYKQPHNSFLELHAKFGFLGFILVISLLALTFARLCKKRDIVWLIVFIACGIRAMLDWVAFPGCIDVLFWFFCIKKILNIEKKSEI